MLSENDDVLNGENSQFVPLKYKAPALEFIDKLHEAKQLLKEAVEFMNIVPNRKYRTMHDGNEHYKLCSRIDKFLNE